VRLTILAIDGMDREVCTALGQRLPNIHRLTTARPRHEFASVFPPDTDSAWASFYTGLSPAEHGVFKYRDPRRSDRQKRSPTDQSIYQGRTFWDLASQRGKRVALSLPHNIDPGWAINGVMVTRSQTDPSPDSPLRVTGASIPFDRALLRAVNGERRVYTDAQLGEARSHLMRKFEAEATVAWEVYRREPWDLYFAYFSVVDGAQHYFWQYHEAKHPGYRAGHPFEGVVTDVYERADRLIGRYMESAAADEHLLILSDHGHGRRPTQLLNVNEFLRQRGLLRALPQGTRSARYYIKRSMRQLVSAYVSRFGLPPLADSVSRMFPAFKRDLTATGGVDYANSLAFVSEMPSMKGYNYGGIRVNGGPRERGAIIEQVTDALRALRHPETGQPLVSWLVPRERVDAGKYLEDMPDLLMETDPDFGISSPVHRALVEPGFMHRVQSGAHRRLTPVLWTHNFSEGTQERLRECSPGTVSLMALNRFVSSVLDQ